MLYIFWSLLNIGIFLFFILICFRATKLVREKLGIIAAVIFVIGLLSFVANPNNENDNLEPNSNQLRTWKFNSSDSLEMGSLSTLNIVLEKTIISKYKLGISYGKEKRTQINIPLSANSWTTGLISGTNWKPSSITVNKTEDNSRFQYDMYGVLEWKLLGLTVYSQYKSYKGYALIK